MPSVMVKPWPLATTWLRRAVSAGSFTPPSTALTPLGARLVTTQTATGRIQADGRRRIAGRFPTRNGADQPAPSAERPGGAEGGRDRIRAPLLKPNCAERPPTKP